jgi:hypothetical protein
MICDDGGLFAKIEATTPKRLGERPDHVDPNPVVNR